MTNRGTIRYRSFEIHFDDIGGPHSQELALIDDLVAQGVADSRSAVIREAIHHLADRVRRARVGADIAASYRERPQTTDDDDLALANAIAMTEAEPW